MFVYRLYYKAVVSGAQLLSTQVAAPEVSDFVSAFSSVTCIRGNALQVLDPAQYMLRRYRSAFYVFLNAPVKRDYVDDRLMALKAEWEAVLGAGAYFDSI